MANTTYPGFDESLCPTTDPSKEYVVDQFKFWVDGVGLSVMAIVGVIGNLLSIVVLSHPDIRNSFNLLLIGLSVFDSIYVIVSFFEALRKSFSIVSNLHLRLFPYVIYPSQMISLTGSVFSIISITFERYVSVHHPLDYNLAVNDASAINRRLLKFLFPVILFSLVFNLPKFFETRVLSYPGHGSPILKIGVTEMRLSPTYSAYITLSEFIILGVIPVALLCYFNTKIYQDLKEREQRLRRPHLNPPAPHNASGTTLRRSSLPINASSRGNPNSSTVSNNVRRRSTEDRMAKLFMAIVLIFLICHTPRMIVNFYEMFTFKTTLECARRRLPFISAWVEIMISVSSFILVLNSSINILIYCVFNPQFRKAARKRVIQCLPNWK